MAYSVSQNTSLYTAASVIQKAVSFIYFTIVARLIGVESTGQYFFALSFAAIFTVIADFGLASVLTRESSRYPEQTEKYVTTVLWTKIAFGLGAYILMIASSYILGYDAILKKLIVVAGLTMVFDNLHNVFFGVFRAHRNLLYESIGIIMSQSITMVIGLFALWQRWPLWWLIAAYTIASATTTLFAAYAAHRVYGLRYYFGFDIALFKTFLGVAIPFGVAGILLRFYSYADSIIMSKLLDPVHLGWWSVPYKITFAFQFIPVALSASIYPVMSSLMLTDQQRIGELFAKAWRYLFLIVFPLAFGLGAIAEPLIVKLYGPSYLPSVGVLRILLFSLVFGYLSFVTGATLNATNQQKKQTKLLAITLLTNVLLNFILIPLFNLKGAAAAALIGNMLLAIGGFVLVNKSILINKPDLWDHGYRAFWPAAVMGIVATFLLPYMPFWIIIFVAAGVYFSLLYVSGGLTPEMVREFKSKVLPERTI
jgi:O-antigen/teichoic acid export membrane protein